MTEFQCMKCNYRFKRDKKPTLCPYCGKPDTVGVVPDAEDILTDVNLQDKRMQELEENKKEWQHKH